MATMAQNNLEGSAGAGHRSDVEVSGGARVALQLARDGAEVLGPRPATRPRGAQTVPGPSRPPVARRASSRADLGDVAGVRAAGRGSSATVDILINNAGISRFGPTAEFDVAEVRPDVSPATFERRSSLSRSSRPQWRRGGRGSIVSLSSMAGGKGRGLVGGAAYGATKRRARGGWTRAWAAEVQARAGWRVNAIAPGAPSTPRHPQGPEFIRGRSGEDDAPCARASQPRRRSQRSSRSSRPPRRASYITGTTVAADGGTQSDLARHSRRTRIEAPRRAMRCLLAVIVAQCRERLEALPRRFPCRHPRAVVVDDFDGCCRRGSSTNAAVVRPCDSGGPLTWLAVAAISRGRSRRHESGGMSSSLSPVNAMCVFCVGSPAMTERRRRPDAPRENSGAVGPVGELRRQADGRTDRRVERGRWPPRLLTHIATWSMFALGARSP